ncbi:hypothetical protein C1637_13215 [Chryseobacterium lactis]|uniref:Uncharacterized protein n=1 Tax=Chryseobacterium lactis TaxID=1241981 RepID=A0A3G6RM95_CHRLC|nr:hypothetical protein EG342_19350 [Chryseobacterium lactis]AZB04299.1 hypothetical protein EG341_10225 [Chryseobacterium lactis]PNW12793.1 hypothetical protein C1637_13215 [Chryseobacterium lactis]
MPPMIKNIIKLKRHCQSPFLNSPFLNILEIPNIKLTPAAKNGIAEKKFHVKLLIGKIRISNQQKTPINNAIKEVKYHLQFNALKTTSFIITYL